MKKMLTIGLIAVMAGVATANTIVTAAPLTERVSAGSVKVTVHYKGKGTVDATHKLWVWVFDTPNIGPGVMPLDQIALDKNDSEAVFGAVGGENAWIAVAFDQQGVMQGDAPPPTGSPIGILMADGKPASVTPGDKGVATLTFDDSLRMP